jgi:hypothetical protein
MREVLKFYRLLNLLSLDVAAGAVIGSLFFAKIFWTVPSFSSLISLGLTVWIIYTADRLLDIRKLTVEAASERHRFHQRHQKKLIYWLLVVSTIDFVFIFFLPANIIRYGMLLALAVAIYMVFRNRIYILKEFLIAVLYTAGVILPAWPSNQMTSEQYLSILLFFQIAVINLIVFSWCEKENDLKDKQISLATLLDERMIRFILTSLFLIAFSIGSYMFILPVYYMIPLVLIAMTTTLFLIYLRKDFFAQNDQYRLLGDAVFILPLVYVLT